MRLPFLVAALGLASLAHADRLMHVPTAVKIRYDQVRLEHEWDLHTPQLRRSYAAIGLTRDLEAELQWTSNDTRHLGTANLMYQYIVPIVDTAPGLCVGVLDLMDKTPERRMYYIAITQRLGQDGEFNSHSPVEMTLGFGFGPRNGVFAGVSLPFTWQFRLMAEHDIREPRMGFEYKTHQGLAARIMFTEHSPSLGLRYTFKY